MTTITNRKEALEQVKDWGGNLDNVDDILKADREVVLEAVMEDGDDEED